MRTKRFLSCLIAVVMAVTAAFVMTGCGGEPKTIENYVTENATSQQSIRESLASLENSDMDVSVDYDQNRIIITCQMKSTYKKQVLKTIKKSYKKYMKKNLTEPMENAVANIERETGITGVTIKVIVNNGNGKKIWSQLYPLEAAEAEKASKAAEKASKAAESTKEDSGENAEKDAGASDGSTEE